MNYKTAKKRFEDIFDLQVITTPNAMKGEIFIDKNPKARVDDLHWALQNPVVKAIIPAMGGGDSYRLLPYIDYNIIKENPKIYTGFSDISSSHNMFTYAGVSSFYGFCFLTPLAQPGSLDLYTENAIRKVLFSSDPIGEIKPSEKWRPIAYGEEPIEWHDNYGYEVLQGKGKVSGRLLGGCGEPMRQMLGTYVFPSAEMWRDAIIFMECGNPYGGFSGIAMLRSFAATGMFRLAKGLVCQTINDDEKKDLLRVIRDDEGLPDFPILTGVEIGHRTPMTILPIGVTAEIDCENAKFSVLESGVE